MCRRKGERARRLRSKRCVCPCEPPRVIVILRRRLSITLCGTGILLWGIRASRLDASGLSQKALHFPSLEFRRRGCPANFRQVGSPPAPTGKMPVLLQLSSLHARLEDGYCPTHGASFRCEGRVCSQRHCSDGHLFMRKTFAWRIAGSPEGTNRSSKGLVPSERDGF